MINTQKQKLMFYSIVSLMLSLVTCVKGETTDTKKPEIVLSNVIPVVKKEIEIKIANADSIKEEAVFSITCEGKDVVKEKISPVNGVISKKWIPEETGFYTAVFDFGQKSAIDKVSLEFPVVDKELYFLIWPPLDCNNPKDRNRRYLSSYVICEEKDIAYWKSHGSKVLACVSGIMHPDKQWPGKSESEIIDICVANWSAPMKRGFDGIFIDEFGQYPTRELLDVVELVHKSLVRLRKENPDMLIFPANGGALLREESIAFKYADCIAVLETYHNCFVNALESHSFRKHLDNRVEVARNTDLMYEVGRKHGAIILLGMGCDGGGMSIPQVEDMVRYIKKTAPEMPGIGFCVGAREKEWTEENGLRQSAEDFCLKYYIKPVIDVREMWFSEYTPIAGKELDVLVRIHNLGGMDAKDIQVNIYAVESGSTGREQIGKETVIKKLRAGILRLTEADVKDVKKPYEYREIEGETCPVFPVTYHSTNPVFTDRKTVKISWKPKRKGHFTIISEVKESDNYTILDQTICKDIVVGGTK